MKLHFVWELLLVSGYIFLRGIFGCREEGVKVRLNHEGLVKGHNLLLKVWKRNLLESQLPTIKETDYIINFKIVAVDLGYNDVQTTPPNVIISEIRKGKVLARADWTLFSYIEGKVKQHSGSTLLNFIETSITQQVFLHFTEKAGIMFFPGICKTSIGKILFNFTTVDYTENLLARIFSNVMRKKSEELWFYNLQANTELLRNQYTKLKLDLKLDLQFKEVSKLHQTTFCQLCQTVEETVITEFENLLPLKQMTVPISDALFPMIDDILVDFAPTKAPIVTKNDITFFSRGRCFPDWGDVEDSWTNEKPEVPTPPFSDSNRMFQFILGDYLFNTLNYARYLTNDYNEIDPIDLFNEHFSSDVSAAKLAEDLPVFQNYANRSIEFNISATSAPTTRITPAGIFTYENRKMVVNAILDDGRREAILSLTYVNQIHAQLYVLNDLVHLRVIQMNSTADEINAEALYFNQFRERANIFYLRFLNDVLARDPYIVARNGPFKIVGITVKFSKNGVEFGGDITIAN